MLQVTHECINPRPWAAFFWKLQRSMTCPAALIMSHGHQSTRELVKDNVWTPGLGTPQRCAYQAGRTAEDWPKQGMRQGGHSVEHTTPHSQGLCDTAKLMHETFRIQAPNISNVWA